MANFLIAYPLTAKHEAGYTADPRDSGNWTSGVVGQGSLIGTKYGLSAPLLCKLLGGHATVAGMRDLTIETAQKAFKTYYWDVMKGDEINSQAIANSMYDKGIVGGIVESIKLMQETLSVPVTGVMDTTTLNLLNNQL